MSPKPATNPKQKRKRNYSDHTRMILALRCAGFSFQPGMNVVLAERTKDSTEKDSRNGIGKSTLLEIIHFCLGSQAKGDQGVMHPSLNGWTFYLDLLVGGKKVTVGRNTAEPKVVTVLPEEVETRPGELLAVKGGDTFPVGQWTDFLGEKLFALPADGEGRDDGNSAVNGQRDDSVFAHVPASTTRQKEPTLPRKVRQAVVERSMRRTLTADPVSATGRKAGGLTTQLRFARKCVSICQ